MSDEELVEDAIAKVLERWAREDSDELKDIGEEGKDEHGNL